MTSVLKCSRPSWFLRVPCGMDKCLGDLADCLCHVGGTTGWNGMLCCDGVICCLEHHW